MQRKENESFDDLVEHFLGERLPDGMTADVTLSKMSPETQQFLIRTLTLMKAGGYSATGFNPHLIRWLTVTVPSVLPSAWGGKIPPITLPGRHKKLDHYVAQLDIPPGNKPLNLLDIGCGFPPATPADTAQMLS